MWRGELVVFGRRTKHENCSQVPRSSVAIATHGNWADFAADLSRFPSVNPLIWIILDLFGESTGNMFFLSVLILDIPRNFMINYPKGNVKQASIRFAEWVMFEFPHWFSALSHHLYPSVIVDSRWFSNQSYNVGPPSYKLVYNPI